MTFVIVTDDLAVAPPLFSLSLGAHIVVADDEPDIRRLIVLILTRRGHTVREAAAGDEALALIRRERPDLCVLDVMMPGLSGLEVARELAADRNTAGIPLILLSAKGQAAEVEAGLSTGARAYLVKPFSPIELARLVGEVLSATALEPQ